MIPFELKTYRAQNEISAFQFYILNKGNNSGRPMLKPCPNCFTLKVKSQTDFDFYYWLCYGLFVSKKYFPVLFGSVVPFVRIDEVKKIIHSGSLSIEHKQIEYFKKVKLLTEIEKHEKKITEQLKLLKQVKSGILRPFL